MKNKLCIKRANRKGEWGGETFIYLGTGGSVMLVWILKIQCGKENSEFSWLRIGGIGGL
jgi:hypothetical protein